MTPARAALHDLIATMQAIANAYSAAGRRQWTGELTADEMAKLDKLEARQHALEQQLQQMVQEQLGVDYATLWHAVTPTTKPTI
jgi:hypothetical protein